MFVVIVLNRAMMLKKGACTLIACITYYWIMDVLMITRLPLSVGHSLYMIRGVLTAFIFFQQSRIFFALFCECLGHCF